MRTFGWFIVAAAVALHLTYCRYGDSSPDLFGLWDARTISPIVAGIMGVMFPLLMAGGGAWLISTGQRRAELRAKSK